MHPRCVSQAFAPWLASRDRLGGPLGLERGCAAHRPVTSSSTSQCTPSMSLNLQGSSCVLLFHRYTQQLLPVLYRIQHPRAELQTSRAIVEATADRLATPLATSRWLHLPFSTTRTIGRLPPCALARSFVLPTNQTIPTLQPRLQFYSSLTQARYTLLVWLSRMS